MVQRSYVWKPGGNIGIITETGAILNRGCWSQAAASEEIYDD